MVPDAVGDAAGELLVLEELDEDADVEGGGTKVGVVKIGVEYTQSDNPGVKFEQAALIPIFHAINSAWVILDCTVIAKQVSPG